MCRKKDGTGAMWRFICLLCAVLVLGVGCANVAMDSTETSYETNSSSEATTLPVETTVKKDFEFSDLPNVATEFTFAGAGGWHTTLYVENDGSFIGEFLDSDMGDAGYNYPNGTKYWCNFSGKFSKPIKQSDYVYILVRDTMQVAQEKGIVTYDDGFRNISSSPYGMEEADVIYLYLPGTPITEIKPKCINMLFLEDYECSPTNQYILYNEKGNSVFTSWNGMPDYVEGSCQVVPLETPLEIKFTVLSQEPVRHGPNTYFSKITELDMHSIVTVSALRAKESGMWGFIGNGWINMAYCLPENNDTNLATGSLIQQLDKPLQGILLSEETVYTRPDPDYQTEQTVSIHTPVTIHFLVIKEREVWGFVNEGWINIAFLKTETPHNLGCIYTLDKPPQEKYRVLKQTWIYAGPGEQYRKLENVQPETLITAQGVLQYTYSNQWVYTDRGWIDMDVLSQQTAKPAPSTNILSYLGSTLDELSQVNGLTYTPQGYYAGSDLVQFDQIPGVLYADNGGKEGLVALYINQSGISFYYGLHSSMNLSQVEAAAQSVPGLINAYSTTYFDELDGLGNITDYTILTGQYLIRYEWYVDLGGNVNNGADVVFVRLKNP